MGDLNYCISKIMDNYLNDVKEVEGSVRKVANIQKEYQGLLRE